MSPDDIYFDGMLLLSENTRVIGDDGLMLPAEDLRPGDEVGLWIERGCDESNPVQCDVTVIAVRTREP